MSRVTAPQPFLAHLQELRSRLVWCALTLIAGSVLGYIFRGWLIPTLQNPLHGPLYYTSPTGGLEFLIKICIAFGLTLSLPVFMYQLVRFLEPAMSHHSRHLILRVLPASVILLVVGVTFAYFVSLPPALHFLASFNTSQIHPLISTSEYLSFILIYLVWFGLIFQLPLLLLTINRITPLGPSMLLRHEGGVVLTSFIVSAIVTPTQDPWNMTIMALPMIALYQVSILLIWFINRRAHRHHTRVESEAALQKIKSCLGQVAFEPSAEDQPEITAIPEPFAGRPSRAGVPFDTIWTR